MQENKLMAQNQSFYVNERTEWGISKRSKITSVVLQACTTLVGSVTGPIEIARSK